MNLTSSEERELKRLTLNLQAIGVNKSNIEEKIKEIGQAVSRNIYSS